MIGLRLKPVFEMPRNLARFSESMRPFQGRRLVSLAYPEDLESARKQLARRGFFILGEYPFRLPFFSSHTRLDLVALDLKPPHPLPTGPGELARILGTRRQDNLLTGGLDSLPDGGVIHGPLAVRGWARIPGEDLDVRILIDGDKRSDVPIRRVSRPDVCSALPQMADCSKAGFEARFRFEEGDEGTHEITVVFLSRDGRYRIYPPVRFTWMP